MKQLLLEGSRAVKVPSKALKLMAVRRAVNQVINQAKVAEKEKNLVHQKEKILTEKNLRNRKEHNSHKILALLKRYRMLQMVTLWFLSV